MKKKLVALLMSAIMATGLAACGSTTDNSTVSDTSTPKTETQADTSAEASAADGAKTVINVYSASDLEKSLDGQIAAYQAIYPEVEIVKHIIANDDYDDKMKVLLSGSADEVDVFWCRTPSQVKQYMGANILEDLAPYAVTSGVDLAPIKDTALIGVAGEGDSFYGLPVTSSCWMVFYNKELFDAAGEPYPGQMTFDEYCTLAEKLTHKEGETQYWGGMCPPWTMNLGASSAGEYLTDDAPLTKTMEYAEILKRMYDLSHVPLGEMATGAWDCNAYFEAGNIYMMILGDWGYRMLNTEFEYGTAPLPVMDGAAAGSSVGQASYLCVSAKSPNKHAAYDFIEFYTTSDEGTSVSASFGDVPAYATDAAMAVYEENVTVDGVEYRFAARVHNEQGTHPKYSDINENYKAELQLYLLGEQSLEDCFNNFYKIREEIMAD